METVRFGFLGIGDIARRVIPFLQNTAQVQVEAAAAREFSRAQSFAKQWRIPKAYGSYDELFADEEIDVIYIGTPHPLHENVAVRALQAGKHVLCEKPIGANAAQVKRMIDEARRQQRFLMEANWRRFMPAMIKMRELIHSGAVGKIHMVDYGMGYFSPFQYDPQSRLFAPALGGGAMLDLGVYCLSFVYDMMKGQNPSKIAAMAQLAPSGVDLQTAVLMQYEGDTLAVLRAGLGTQMPRIVRVIAEHCTLQIDEGDLSYLQIIHSDGREERLPFNGADKYRYEFVAAADCIRAGQLESEISPLQQSLDMARASDEIRRQIGVHYPFDEEE